MTFFRIFYTIYGHTYGKSKEELYKEAEGFHTSLDRRLRMLLRKSFLSENEELEMKTVKKEKLYYKDIMEGLKREES